MRMLTIAMAAALATLPSVPSLAATQLPTQLTLEQAVTEGLGHSPEIQRVQSAQSESEWHATEIKGAHFLPKISLNAHHFFKEKYSFTEINFGNGPLLLPGFYPTTLAALDFTIPLFDGLSGFHTVQAEYLTADAIGAELSYAEFQLKQEIRLAFYQALAADQLQEVARQNVKTLEDHLKQIEAQKHGGVATNYDVLRVQVQLNEARSDAIDAQDQVEATRHKLTELLGLELDDRVPTGTLPIPNPERIKGLSYTDAPHVRGDLRGLGLRAEAANRTHSARGAWFVPSVYLGGEYAYYETQILTAGVQDTGRYKSSYSFGIYLRWNLFDGGVAIAQERESAYRAAAAEKAVQSARIRIPRDFEYWRRRYLSNADHYVSKKFDIGRSEESVRLAKAEEKAGTRTSTETLDAELDLFRAKAGVVHALVNAIEAEIRLELSLGRKL